MPRKWTPLKRYPGVYSYPTQKGKRYGTRRKYKSSTGKSDYWSKSGFLSAADADLLLKKFELELATDKVGQIEGHKVTVDAYFWRIYDRKVKLNIWRPITSRSMKNYYKEWFQAPFGNVKLDELSRSAYQEFIDSLAEKDLAKNTVERINSVMQLIMNDAETNDIIYKNKLRHMNINGKAPRDQSLSKDDFDAYMKYAKEHLSRYDYSMIYMLTLGERRAELMGLRTRSSFQFEFDEVNQREVCAIKFDMGRTSEAKDGGPLKTPSAYRTIWVYGEMVDTIRFAIKASDNILMNLGKPVPQDHFLWLNPQTGNPFHPAQPSTLMKRLSGKCGIKVHPHQLRHYFATRAKSDRLFDSDVMHWLGHANIQQTNDYTRASKEGAMNVFNGIKNDI